MRPLDYIAVILFALWIFGVLHFIAAFALFVLLYGIGYKRYGTGYFTLKR